MIFDDLKNTPELPGYLVDALALLRKQDLAALPSGRHELDGDRVYLMVMEYDTKPAETLRFEAHVNYIDVQYLVSGTERLDYLPIGTKAALTEDRLAKDDVAFYAVEKEPSQLVLHAGLFAILYPGELHKPCGTASAVSKVKKIVMKVRARS